MGAAAQKVNQNLPNLGIDHRQVGNRQNLDHEESY